MENSSGKTIKTPEQNRTTGFIAAGILGLIVWVALTWWYGLIVGAAIAGMAHGHYVFTQRTENHKPIFRSLLSALLLGGYIIAALFLMVGGGLVADWKSKTPEQVAKREQQAQQKAQDDEAKRVAEEARVAEEKKQQEQAAATKQKEKEAIIAELAPVYCKNHPTLKLAQGDADGLKEAGFPDLKGKKLTLDMCKQIIDKRYSYNTSKEDIQNIANERYWIGMSVAQLVLSVGSPTDANNTTTAFGSHNQLIYGDPLYGATYIYTDNGKVTSYQD